MSTLAGTPRGAASPVGGAADLGPIARGGALNLLGAATYGLANFALVVVVTSRIGARGVGQFLIAVAIFNILVKVSELGAATGFVRAISRDVATGRAASVPVMTVAALVPVAVAGSVLGGLSWLLAPQFARLFAAADTAEVVVYSRTLAPFLPVAALYSVTIQGTKGFATMLPQSLIEKMGKALVQPVAALMVLSAGAGPRGLALAWVLPVVVAAVPTAIWFRALVRRATAGAGPFTTGVIDAGMEFWRFAAPRALGQIFQVTILWFDTLLIGAILGVAQAGIYAAATRYLLVGTFVAEAIMQVVAPRVSALLARGERDGARRVFQAATSWQVLLVWPVFLVVTAFSSVLLQPFGREFAAGAVPLSLLAVAILVSCIFGPSDTVILMAGRSRLSLLNTVVALTINVGGNLILTPRYGLVGAATAWAASIVAAAALPASQAWRRLGLHPFGQATATAAMAAVGTVGLTCVVARAAVGPTAGGMIGAVLIGGALFAVGASIARRRLGLLELWRAFLRR